MHENEFTVSVRDLENGPVTIKVDTDASRLELEDPDYEFPERVTGDVVYSLVRPRVVGKGTLYTTAKTQCVRCLNDAHIRVAAPVTSIYESEKSIRETRGDVVPEEQIITPFNGEWIQPEDELRESIMLELPTLPLCRPDCKGLCPKCGADLNEGPCGCSREDEDVSPWKSAIKGLKLPGDTE